MDKNVKDYQPYRRAEPPEGAKKLNLGSYWYSWYNERKLVCGSTTDESGNSVPRPRSTLTAAHLITADRHNAMMGGYTPKFKRSTITDKGLLGRGTFGSVWQCEFPKAPMVALKQVSLTATTLPEEIWKERDLLIKLKHMRVVNLLGAFFHCDAYFIFELCVCSLNQKIRDLEDEHKTRFTIQLAEAIQWIHSKDVIHCDLKPDNLLITTSNNLVLSDFGGAIQLENGTDVIKSQWGRGVAGYQDYEANKYWQYSKASDVFSMGCVLHEIWTGIYLLRYNSEWEKTCKQPLEEYLRAIQVGRVPGIMGVQEPYIGASRIPLADRVRAGNHGMYPLIQLMILPRDRRITAEEILEHGCMESQRAELERNEWKLDNGGLLVCPDVLIADRTQSLRRSSTSSVEANVAFNGFYYDEEEIAQQGNEYEYYGQHLQSFSSHVIACFIYRHGLQELLLGGLRSKDPIDLGKMQLNILKELTSGFLGRNELFETGNSEELDIKEACRLQQEVQARTVRGPKHCEETSSHAQVTQPSTSTAGIKNLSASLQDRTPVTAESDVATGDNREVATAEMEEEDGENCAGNATAETEEGNGDNFEASVTALTGEANTMLCEASTTTGIEDSIKADFQARNTIIKVGPTVQGSTVLLTTTAENEIHEIIESQANFDTANNTDDDSLGPSVASNKSFIVPHSQRTFSIRNSPPEISQPQPQDVLSAKTNLGAPAIQPAKGLRGLFSVKRSEAVSSSQIDRTENARPQEPGTLPKPPNILKAPSRIDPMATLLGESLVTSAPTQENFAKTLPGMDPPVNPPKRPQEEAPIWPLGIKLAPDQGGNICDPVMLMAIQENPKSGASKPTLPTKPGAFTPPKMRSAKAAPVTLTQGGKNADGGLASIQALNEGNKFRTPPPVSRKPGDARLKFGAHNQSRHSARFLPRVNLGTQVDISSLTKIPMVLSVQQNTNESIASVKKTKAAPAIVRVEKDKSNLPTSSSKESSGSSSKASASSSRGNSSGDNKASSSGGTKSKSSGRTKPSLSGGSRTSASVSPTAAAGSTSTAGKTETGQHKGSKNDDATKKDESGKKKDKKTVQKDHDEEGKKGHGHQHKKSRSSKKEEIPTEKPREVSAPAKRKNQDDEGPVGTPKKKSMYSDKSPKENEQDLGPGQMRVFTCPYCKHDSPTREAYVDHVKNYCEVYKQEKKNKKTRQK